MVKLFKKKTILGPFQVLFAQLKAKTNFLAKMGLVFKYSNYHTILQKNRKN